MIEIDSNEQILRVVRKHWFVFLGNLIILIVAILFPVVIFFALSIIPIKEFLDFSGAAIYAEAFFFFAWLLIVWMIGWTLWSNYYLDVLIVTDKRVFTIEQIGFFKRVSSSFRIDRIQNTTIHQDGIIQTLLDFGTIRLETAGESEDFVGTWIAHPYGLKKFLNELHDQALERSQLVHIETGKHQTGSVPRLDHPIE
ncbi:MAG: PH domain-containing protein [bacterium]|nr:PH domain-containing protein [bacterium]